MGLSWGKSRFSPKALTKQFHKSFLLGKLKKVRYVDPQDADCTKNMVDSH